MTFFYFHTLICLPDELPPQSDVPHIHHLYGLIYRSSDCYFGFYPHVYLLSPFPLLKTYKKLQTSMFHSYFNEYAFDDINIYLLTSSCTLHRRKFRTNVSVHICINVSVSACKFFSISLEIYRCLEISVNHIPTRTSINSVR